MVRFTEFGLDESVVAASVYQSAPHYFTPQGVVIPRELREELSEFLSAFNTFVEAGQMPYYRIDAYVYGGVLWILELNASFVDGWGTALNLCRASGGSVEKNALAFPARFATQSRDYLPELELFVAELGLLGVHGCIVPFEGQPEQPTYVYGRVGTKGQPNILPFDGLRLDDKRNLAGFSRLWRGRHVQVPCHYICGTNTWEDIPSNAVLKFCDKSGEGSKQARTSVLVGKPEGKAKFLRRCFAEGELLAQEFIQPAQHPLGNTQIIILAAGNTPVTGYVQFSRKEVINDNSIHGPLWLE